MRIDIPCLCGRILNVGAEDGDQQVLCPSCGRPHAVPALFDRNTKEKTCRSWIPIVGSAAGEILIFATLVWALMAGGGLDGQGDSTGDSGTDPHANKLERGVETGDENGLGDGTGGEGLGKKNEGDGGGAGNSEPSPDVVAKSPTSQPVAKPISVVDVPDPRVIANLDKDPVVTPQPVDKPDDAPVVSGKKKGSGGPYGQRGSQSVARKMGASAESESAVVAGLAWLAKVQCKDGHWTVNGREGGGESYNVGHTGLATLAFLGAGHTHKGKTRYRDNVRRALEWLIRKQAEDPLGSACSRNFYEQGIAATALCEAYGMTKDHKLKRPCIKAIDFIVNHMGGNGGFGYDGAGDDAHVTSFQVMAVKSSGLAGLEIQKDVFSKLKGYYDAALDKDFTTGYGIKGRRGDPRSVRTALGLFCRIFLGVAKKDPKVQGIAALVDRTGPQIRSPLQTYYGTYGMFQMGGERWKKWNKVFRDTVVALQTKEGRDKGSWPKAGHMPGLVCSTAIRIMSLEVYYRYLPVNK